MAGEKRLLVSNAMRDILSFLGDIAQLPFLFFLSTNNQGNGKNGYRDMMLKIAGAIIMFMLVYGWLELNNKITNNSTSNVTQWKQLAELQSKQTELCTEVRNLTRRLDKIEDRHDEERRPKRGT